MPPHHHLHHLLLLLLLISTTTTTTSTAPYTPTPTPTTSKSTAFIKSACSSAPYPSLCLKTCLPYAGKIKSNPQKLIVAALSAALSAAQSAASAVADLSQKTSHPKYEANAIKDCIDDVADSIDDLKQSIQEIDGLGKSKEDVKFKIANVQTWMSAAITNEDTCMDEIGEKRVDPDVRRKIRGQIVGVAKLTSNALSLCNHLQYY